jgi:predicted AlkP superfamily phosphohydrolase/phosphomutase
MSESRKLLVLALDAASPPLLRRWTADGTLPNLARAMSRGLVADTRAPEGMEVGATWPTFYTGLGPAGHGMCWSDRVLPGTYRQQELSMFDVDHLTPFWRTLSAAGKRVVVLDVPFTPPATGINGIQVVEWGIHDGIHDFHTVPKPLAAHLSRTYGTHPPPPECDTLRTDAAGYRDLRDRFVKGIELRGAMTRELLADGNWDFAIQNFNEIHCAGHMLWHYHDPSHPNFDSVAASQDGDLLREVYVATDKEIGLLLEMVGSDVTVLIGSLHGMEHTAGSSLLLPHIMEALGAFAPARGSSQATKSAPNQTASAAGPIRQAKGPKGMLKMLWHLVPRPLREAQYNLRQWINTRYLQRGAPINIDPTRSKAFQMGFGAGSTFSGIRLNLKGREVGGILERGVESDQFIADLTAGLMEMINPETQRPLVRRVVRTADLFQGPRLEDLPDLMVEWEYDAGRGSTAVGDATNGIWRGWSERVGTVEHGNGSGRTGAHRVAGLMVAIGPTITPGTLDRFIEGVDFTPTILAHFGLTLPNAEGRVIPEIVTRDA